MTAPGRRPPESWLGAVAAGGDDGVAGGGVDDRDAGVFMLVTATVRLAGSKEIPAGLKPTVTVGGVCPHPVVVVALQVAPLNTETVLGLPGLVGQLCGSVAT